MSTELPAIVGLTGGIATGKSTVSQMLRDLGARVIDADVIARQIVEPGQPALLQIKEAFGDEVIDDDGRIDRAKLGQRIFSDPEARQTLNNITHPMIAMEMMKQAQDAGEAGYSWVIYDAALLVENRIHTMLAGLLVVGCEPQTQLDRLRSRDSLSDADAKARIAAQLPLADKIAVANWVIDNNGTIAQTHEQVEQVYRALQEKFGTKAGS